MRELVALAHKREMESALTDLEARFSVWRAGEIDCFDLNNLIHEHHNGIARHLWKKYGLDADILLPYLVADGIIAESEIPHDLLEQIKDRIQSARDFREECDEPPEE